MESLYSDPSLQAVHICNANAGHFAALECALQNGKAVICEKPLVGTLSEAMKIERLAKESRSFVTVCYVFRFLPTVFLLRHFQEKIGKILSISISYLQSSWLKKSGTGWKPTPDVYGDSYVLADIGSHAIDMAQTFLQKPLELKEATIHYKGEPRACSDIKAQLMLQTVEHHVPTLITVSKAEEGISNQFSIKLTGEEGELVAESLLDEKICLKRGRHTEWIERTPAATFSDLLQFPPGHPEGWLSGFVNLFHSFYQEMSPGFQRTSPRSFLPTISESVQLAKLIDDALHMGTWIPM